MITQPKNKTQNSKRIKSDWYIVGSRLENGRDELWNFWDEPLSMSPPYIQGKKHFINALKNIYGRTCGKRLALDIIHALDNTCEEEITDQDKINILTAIDRYYEDYLGEDFFKSCFNPYSQNPNIVVYSLLLKGES